MLRLRGWRIEGERPPFNRYVMVAAPHTSNWDFPFTMAMALVMRIDIHWTGKAALFRGPQGIFFRWMGGVPVNRSERQNIVQQMIDVFDRVKSMVLVIQPEGSRSKVREWKSGFYHIALGAGVPIVLGFIDFKRKVGGLFGHMNPTGDYEKDLEYIKSFYTDVAGKK